MDERVRQILELAKELVKSPPKETVTGSYPSSLEPIVKWINSLASKELKVAYLGPPGSYTHQAAALGFPSAKLIATRSISEVFEVVVKGEADYGVVPIANKLEGPVNETIDNLFYHNLFVSKSIEIPIRIVLASGTVRDVSEIKKIYGHPMIFGQARRLLDELKVPTISTRSTSEAAKIAAQEEGAAALCSPLAAELYGLKVLRESVEDHPENSTKFFVISKYMSRQGELSALIVSVPHHPGGLYKFLEPFAKRNVNLTMVYSRPMKTLPWKYIFYVELEGSIEGLEDVLEEAKERANFMKLLGSYNSLELSL